MDTTVAHPVDPKTARLLEAARYSGVGTDLDAIVGHDHAKPALAQDQAAEDLIHA